MRPGERLMGAGGFFSFAVSSAFMQLFEIPRFRFSVTLFGPGYRCIVINEAAPGGRMEARGIGGACGAI